MKTHLKIRLEIIFLAAFYVCELNPSVSAIQVTKALKPSGSSTSLVSGALKQKNVFGTILEPSLKQKLKVPEIFVDNEQSFVQTQSEDTSWTADNLEPSTSFR